MAVKKNKRAASQDKSDAFPVSKGVLRANHDLYWEYLEEFDAACNRLLDSRKSRLEVDLTAVNFISSSFVGCLGNLIMSATRFKKRVCIKVTLDVSWLFDIMGAQKMMDIEVV